MKKPFFAAALTVALCIVATPVTLVASAEINQEECDKLFAATVNALIDESEVENGTISALRKPLYDISVEPLGYVYEFSLKDSEGYAIIVNTEGEYVAQEVMPHSVSPYAESEGQCVYVGTMTYLEYSEGVYTDAKSGTVIPDEVVEILAEDALYGGGAITGSQVVHIEYKNRAVDEYLMAYSVPHNTSAPYSSACACIAGSSIVAFYDRYCPELMPNYVPGREIMGYYFYNGQTTEMFYVAEQLFHDMGTSETAGTTTAQFLSGMKKFVNRAGYTFSYSSCMSGGNFNYSAAKNGIVNNKVTALFLSGFNVIELGEEENKDLMRYTLSKENHVMVGYGYRDVTYTYDSGAQETFNFMYVASGISDNTEGYFNINYNTKINDAYSVSIT